MISGLDKPFDSESSRAIKVDEDDRCFFDEAAAWVSGEECLRLTVVASSYEQEKKGIKPDNEEDICLTDREDAMEPCDAEVDRDSSTALRT